MRMICLGDFSSGQLVRGQAIIQDSDDTQVMEGIFRAGRLIYGSVVHYSGNREEYFQEVSANNVDRLDCWLLKDEFERPASSRFIYKRPGYQDFDI